MLDGEQKTLLVHRKGSTRAFPPHHPLIPVDYQVSMMSTRFESFTFIPTKHTRLLGLVIKCGCVQIGLEESKHYQIELKRITTNKTKTTITTTTTTTTIKRINKQANIRTKEASKRTDGTILVRFFTTFLMHSVCLRKYVICSNFT